MDFGKDKSRIDAFYIAKGLNMMPLDDRLLFLDIWLTKCQFLLLKHGLSC